MLKKWAILVRDYRPKRRLDIMSNFPEFFEENFHKNHGKSIHLQKWHNSVDIYGSKLPKSMEKPGTQDET